MSDKNITCSQIEVLLREVTRIEFSAEYNCETVEAAREARNSLEKLLKFLP